MSKAHLTSHTDPQAQSCWLRLRTRRSVSGGPREDYPSSVMAKASVGWGFISQGFNSAPNLYPVDALRSSCSTSVMVVKVLGKLPMYPEGRKPLG